MQRNKDLLIVSSLAVLAVIVSIISAGHTNALNAALSLPLVLFLPGYAFSAALLPDGRAGLAERLAISLGLSIAIAGLGGLLLNFLPGGLTADSWRFLLLGVTLTAAVWAYVRRRLGRISGPGPLVTQISMREVALLSSAALLIGLALGFGALGIDPTTGSNTLGTGPFTQMWAVPAQNGQQTVVHLGLHNYEGESVSYMLTLEADGRVLAEWPQVTLQSGADWQAQAALPQNFAGKEVTANVYRAGDAAPYRHVRLTVLPGGAQ